jgi:hypothetical protein
MLRITSTGALSTLNLSELPVNWLNLLKKGAKWDCVMLKSKALDQPYLPHPLLPS